MTDINEDPSNCGACGVRCAAGEYCLHGMCSAHEWITTSEFSTCAAISGRAYCWGQNLSQSVAAGGANASSPTPVAMAAAMDRTFMIAHGREATAAIAASASEPADVGYAFYWGSLNTIDGMTSATTATPARLPSVLEPFVEVSAAHSIAQFCARTSDRRVFCWGRDDMGGLARPPAIPMGSVARQPQEVPALSGAVELSMGDRFGCARMCGGRVLCWGSNEDHQLGRETGAELYDATPAPVRLAGGAELNDAISIAAGFNHACAVRANGTVVCWGANQCGQLGDGSAVMSDCVYNAAGDQAVDTAVPNTVRGVGGTGMLSGALSVSVGQSTSCAVVRSGGAGVLYCWGANHFQQIRYLPELGNWTTAPLDVRLGAGESVVQASVGYGHVCARLASGAVRCWGRGNFGQLGASGGDAGATPFSSSRDR
jgi:alpha-tubulin suppressor-like RCC1 family protein